MTGPTAQVIRGTDDAAIFAAARRALDRLDEIAGTVRVHVVGGLVTLTGMVRSPRQRAVACEAVLQIEGVRGLSNRITIMPASADSVAPD